LEALSEIIRELVGTDVPQRVIFQCARSIVGQILFYHFARTVIERVFPDERIDSAAIEELSAHVATFSLGGLREIAKGGRP
jgi:hypothetical protein